MTGDESEDTQAYQSTAQYIRSARHKLKTGVQEKSLGDHLCLLVLGIAEEYLTEKHQGREE